MDGEQVRVRAPGLGRAATFDCQACPLPGWEDSCLACEGENKQKLFLYGAVGLLVLWMVNR